MFQENKQKWSYLAGLIDGEGCITINAASSQSKSYGLTNYNRPQPFVKYSCRVSVTNTDVRLMKWLISTFGGVYYMKREATGGHKASYEWRPKGAKNAEQLLLAILPYLVVKREQAAIVLEYVRMNGEKNQEKRSELYERIATLNRKGARPTTNTLDCPDSGQKIESELHGDMQSAPDVNQVLDEETQANTAREDKYRLFI